MKPIPGRTVAERWPFLVCAVAFALSTILRDDRKSLHAAEHAVVDYLNARRHAQAAARPLVTFHAKIQGDNLADAARRFRKIRALSRRRRPNVRGYDATARYLMAERRRDECAECNGTFVREMVVSGRVPNEPQLVGELCPCVVEHAEKHARIHDRDRTNIWSRT